MGVAARIGMAACLWSVASGLATQADPTPARLRAQQIVAATKIGHEEAVPCSQIEADGQALLELGRAAVPNSTDRALVAYRLAVQSARCSGAARLLGVALQELAGILQGYSPDTALAPAKESVEVLQGIDDPAALAAALNTLGNVYWWLNGLDDALDAFQRSLDISTADGDRSRAARTENNIANVLKVRGEYAAALDHLTRALATFDALGDRPRGAIVLNNIAQVYSYWGDNATALEYSGRALALGRAEGNQSVVAKSLDTIAEFYRASGAYDLALQSFQQALKIRMALDERAGITETTHNIGLVYLSQGEYELAIAAFSRGLHLDRDWKMGDDSVEAEGLRNIGAAAWRLGQRARAAADFRQSLAVVRRTGNRYREAEILDDLGEMALADRHLVESSRLFTKSLAIRRDLGDQAGICQSLTSLATARLAADRPQAALDLASQALDSPVIRARPDLLWKAQTIAGRAYRRLGLAADAKALLNQAIDSIEHIAIGAPGSEGLGLHFFEDKLLPYHELVSLSIERHEIEEAVSIAERSKARVLTRLIGSVRADDGRLLSDAERRERGRLHDEVLALNRRIADQVQAGGDAARIDVLESSRQAAREAVDAFEATLAARHPELATAPAPASPLTFSEAARIVTDSATAVVEYVVSDEQVFALLLTRDGARVTADGRVLDVDHASLTRRVDHLRTEIGSRDFAFTSDARGLYDTLLGPFRKRLAGVTHLIVVPDDVLWRVPFQALRGPEGFVVETAAVSYAPSMAALREIQQLPKSTRPRTVLAMAKTQFDSPELEALPEAADQVRLIRDIYGPGRAAVFVGDAATEARFKTEAPRYSVLHLATHGVLEEASPLYSHLVLTPSAGIPAEDGRLEAREIMRLRLTADLVVLAACDTGRGRTAPGEGIIGTTWALFAAGARSTVVSQFRVESKSTTALLVGFHRRLADGTVTKADALRAAALDLLHTKHYAHPYYWAGFILVGDPN